MSTKFFTNSNERNLFDKFTGIIKHMKDLYAFHAVVGYFRSSGYFELQKYLKDVKSIKILVGINVDKMFAEANKKGLLFYGDDERTKEEFLKWFIEDIKEAKYSSEVENGIIQFVNDLIDGRIEVKAHNSKNIHAKFYLLLPEHHSEHSDGWVIMGSSNLTNAGLGIKKTPNYEMNIALKDYDDVEFTKNEFTELWKEATTILPTDIQLFKQKTHIGQSFTPYELYIKFLIEYFGKNIDYDPDTVGDLPKTYKKLSYQIDAVNQGFQMLEKHNGFFLADVVGLGKTVIAAMIAKRFLVANGSLNTKILVVFPPSLEKNWKNTFRLFGIDKHVKFITNGRLEKIVNGNDLNYWPKEEYDLILVDEAHRYRNHKSIAFEMLQRICKSPRIGDGLIKGTNKKVILISATPLNNKPQDLYYQLLLFQNSRRTTIENVPNLQTFFGPIIRAHKELTRKDNVDIEKIREISSTIREKVISQLTVRRTRRDLKNYPKYIDDLREQGIVFPEIAPPKAKFYEFDSNLKKLFYETILYLTDKNKINYFRYQAIKFLKSELRDEYYEQAELISQSLAGIMKTFMVKRLESSFFAFKNSLRKIAISTERMIEMFQQDKILIAPSLNVNELMEQGSTLEEIEEMMVEKNLKLEKAKNNVFKTTDFAPELLTGLKNDLTLLKHLVDSWSKIEQDPKMETFFFILEDQLLNKSINPTSKLVIFTESSDTANYLTKKIEEKLNTKVLNISSQNSNSMYETIQENFDANFLGEQKNDYNIIVTTDVLAEGINLHRANVIVNYDTPWNAIRMMQRIGRVNRIGSSAGIIYSYNFYPSQQGDDEIKLYKKALSKLQAHHTTFGEDAKIYTHEEFLDEFELFKEGDKGDEDKRLIFLRFIREFKESFPLEFKRIKNFPLKARTARNYKNTLQEALKGTSIVFLKSKFKTEFYLVDENLNPTSISFLEAAEIFQSKTDEIDYALPQSHYLQIQEALKKFEQDYTEQNTSTVTTIEKSDAISSQAKKFLRDMKAYTKNSDTKDTCDKISTHIDLGTFTSLPTEVKKIKQSLDKRIITYAQVEHKLILLARKYDIVKKLDIQEEYLSFEEFPYFEPEIVLSETFID